MGEGCPLGSRSIPLHWPGLAAALQLARALGWMVGLPNGLRPVPGAGGGGCSGAAPVPGLQSLSDSGQLDGPATFRLGERILGHTPGEVSTPHAHPLLELRQNQHHPTGRC